MTTMLTRSANVLEQLDDSDRRALRRLGDVVEVPAGTTIQPQGACSRWFHCVLEGTVAISDGGPPETAGPGACFPDEAVRGDLEPTAASVVAITKVKVLILGLREFHGALDTIPGFAAAMVEATSTSEQRTMLRNAAGTATGGAGAPTMWRSRRDVGGSMT